MKNLLLSSFSDRFQTGLRTSYVDKNPRFFIYSANMPTKTAKNPRFFIYSAYNRTSLSFGFGGGLTRRAGRCYCCRCHRNMLCVGLSEYIRIRLTILAKSQLKLSAASRCRPSKTKPPARKTGYLAPEQISVPHLAHHGSRRRSFASLRIYGCAICTTSSPHISQKA